MPFAVGLAVIVGLFVLLATARGEGRRRIGGLLMAAGLIVALPAAAVVAERADTHVDVVGTRPPGDAPAWSVRCFTVFQKPATADGNAADFVSACSDATRPQRLGAYALGLLAAALTAAGAKVALTKPLGQPAQDVA